MNVINANMPKHRKLGQGVKLMLKRKQAAQQVKLLGTQAGAKKKSFEYYEKRVKNKRMEDGKSVDKIKPKYDRVGAQIEFYQETTYDQNWIANLHVWRMIKMAAPKNADGTYLMCAKEVVPVIQSALEFYMVQRMKTAYFMVTDVREQVTLTTKAMQAAEKFMEIANGATFKSLGMENLDFNGNSRFSNMRAGQHGNYPAIENNKKQPLGKHLTMSAFHANKNLSGGSSSSSSAANGRAITYSILFSNQDGSHLIYFIIFCQF